MSESVNARILGLGHHLPANVVTNAELTRVMETSDEWIQQRTGIRERRYVTEDTGASDLAVEAARAALAEAGV
jgi:3-oxoacyl-[acyl-carrier-protein] synthase-3